MKNYIFLFFALKHRSWVLVRTASVSTHDLCFRVKIRKKIYPCTPQFYYIRVGCKGVFITRTCFRGVMDNESAMWFTYLLFIESSLFLALFVVIKLLLKFGDQQKIGLEMEIKSPAERLDNSAKPSSKRESDIVALA